MLGLDGLDYRAPPEVLSTEKDLISYAVDKSHRIGNIILECFSAMLAPRTALQEHHRYGRLSTSALGLLRYPPNEKIDDNKLGQIAHTDVGSITVLFNRLGGLQVLGNDGEWAFVSPRSGHAVINVGDSLRFLSGRCLKSSLHRVVPHPDTQYKPRYSIAYFMRPELDVEFKDDEGVEWTGIGWHTRKFTVFRAPSEEQKKDSVLTGRKGYLGL